MRIVWMTVIIGIAPFLLGLPWVNVINPRHKISFSYVSGFFMELALYQFICLPFIMLYGQFSSIASVFLICLIICCCLSIWYIRKKGMTEKIAFVRFTWTEYIYIFAFLVFVGLQIIRGFSYDITYMSYDDATYTGIAADAAAGNGVINIDEKTGISTNVILKYSLSSWLIFPSVLAYVSDISVVTIVHTIQYVQLIVLAYAVYWYVAGECIYKRENQLIFMVIISLFYWFGYHSHYSLTFRLLGPNYQGKAVLAVSLTPLILSVLNYSMKRQYTIRIGVYLLLLSIAGVSLTYWATGTLLVVILIPLMLSLFRKERKWEHLLYAIWGCMVPSLAIGYYLLYKYAI